ncbi:MAG: coenzyme F420-0:L-glutamate ligase [Chloroflexota bacterium]
MLLFMSQQLTLTAVSHIPHIQPGDHLATLLIDALLRQEIVLQDGDVLVIAQKIVSKAEGRLFDLAEVVVSPRAQELAEQVGKDPRVVELILQESDEVSRFRPGVLIVRHRLGFTSANAGIDRSNVAQTAGKEYVLLLPVDPDQSAAQLRQAIAARLGVNVGIIISDSHGRPFRMGTVGVAIGVAGVPALWDRRGEADLYGYILEHTDVGVADEIAAAAGLLMGQAAEATPVILVRGLQFHAPAGRATDLVRPKEKDLYR